MANTHDLERAFAKYFDGLATAGETMSAVVHFEAHGRDQLVKHCVAWLDRKITAEQAIARIRHAYNI